MAGIEYQYTAPWTNLTNTATNAAAGLPGQIQDTYNQWHDQPLTAGYNPNLQQAWQTAQQGNPWAGGVSDAFAKASDISRWQNAASGVLDQQGAMLQQGANMLQQAPQEVNKHFGSLDQYQQKADAAMGGYGTAQNYLQQASTAYQPYFNDISNYQTQIGGIGNRIGQATSGTELGQQTVLGALPLVQQATGMLTRGGVYDPNELQKYLNPYTQQAANAAVSDINRNLNENLMPQVNSTFTGAGQFGSTRNQEFANRALRDTQEAAGKALAAANYGAYDKANQFYSDWASKGLQAGSQIGNLASQQAQIAQTQGQLASQQANILSSQLQGTLQNAGLDVKQAEMVNELLPKLAATQGNLTSSQVNDYLKNAGLDAQQANTVANLYPSLASGYSQLGQGYNQMAGSYTNLGNQQLNQAAGMAGIAGQGAGVYQKDFENLMTTGQNQQQYQQQALDRNYQDWMTRQQYPTQMMGALGQFVGNASRGVPPNQYQVSAQPDDLTKALAALQGVSTGVNDPAIRKLLGLG